MDSSKVAYKLRLAYRPCVIGFDSFVVHRTMLIIMSNIEVWLSTFVFYTFHKFYRCFDLRSFLHYGLHYGRA